MHITLPPGGTLRLDLLWQNESPSLTLHVHTYLESGVLVLHVPLERPVLEEVSLLDELLHLPLQSV